MKYIYPVMLDVTIASFLFIGITQNIEGFVNVGYFAGWFFGVVKFLAYLPETHSLKITSTFRQY
ncbi:hypothetical protein [Xenorhabdus indica]|uniref:hypothetical protein n=1 Tax=Xenorhabdus indica TaxID=333964 RepID=UPI001656B381|nr:hypothetical protein [Xenorhabdus indica]MBC8946950.1 hypothetical protein [Xenorhabdus indica]